MIYFVAQIVLALALGSSYSWLLCPLDIGLQHVFVCFTFLLSDTVKCSRLILYIYCLRPRINYFAKNLPLSLFKKWIMVLETRIWALSVLAATGVLFLLALSVDRTKKYMCVCQLIYVLICVMFLYVTTFNYIQQNMSSYW